MSANQEVVFFCWRCGQKLAVPIAMGGKALPCPRCQRMQTVPSGNDVIKRDIPAGLDDELTVTENDMMFNCVQCGWVLIMDKRGAGLLVPCPGCGQLVTAPRPPEVPTRKIGDEPPQNRGG